MLMKCESCTKREATIEFTTVAGNEKTTSHLCPVCTAAFSQQQATEAEGQAQDKSAVKPTFVKKKKVNVVVGHLSKSEAKSTVCPDCKMTYDEFRKVGRLGCPSCYRAFAKPLKRLLKRIHGSDHHVGREPGIETLVSADPPPADTGIDQLDQLRTELAQAVEDEEYERAAQLRDQIAQLQVKDAPDA